MRSFPGFLLAPYLLALLLSYTPIALTSADTTPSPYLGHYLVLNATVTDTPASGRGLPESRPYESSTLPASQRTIALSVRGTNPGALPVLCNLPPWQPRSGSSSSRGGNSTSTEEGIEAVDLRFQCTDPEVSAQLQAQLHLDYNWGFYIVVALNNANPAAWMVRNLTEAAGWQWRAVSGSDMWSFKGGPVMIDSMPNQTLAEWNQFA